jgi:hypothetical protein
VRSPPTVLLIGGGAAYALVAASTTPFTLPADVLTGLAIVGMAVVVIARWPLHTRAPRTPGVSAASASPAADPAGPVDSADPAGNHPYLPWVVILAVFTAWEVFNYLVHGSRSDHPTFSSITDANDRFYVLKALLFFGWMAAALVIVRQGSRQRPARHGARVPR